MPNPNITLGGAPTTIFGFSNLDGGDTAGHNTINQLVWDIETILNASSRLLPAGNTWDFTGKTISVATPSSAAHAATKAYVDSAIGTPGAVSYATLANDAKTYDVPTSGTGVYFTSSGDFTSASLSTASAQNPVVIANHASTTIELSLPNTVGTEGATITVCQTGAASTVIKPKTGATATINGSTSNTYTLGGQYSLVTLLCLSNSGSNGTWVIMGDYY